MSNGGFYMAPDNDDFSKLAIHSPKSGEKCKKEALFGVI
jgi:hypothetical protein